MVMAARGDEPITVTSTTLQVEPPMLLEHTHVDPGAYLRWELESVETGCVLRLSWAPGGLFVLHTAYGRIGARRRGHRVDRLRLPRPEAPPASGPGPNRLSSSGALLPLGPRSDAPIGRARPA